LTIAPDKAPFTIGAAYYRVLWRRY
jgi:hypothetical protein